MTGETMTAGYTFLVNCLLFSLSSAGRAEESMQELHPESGRLLFATLNAVEIF